MNSLTSTLFTNLSLRRLAGVLLCISLLLSACSLAGDGAPTGATSEENTISWDELPIGLGRGYLVAGLEDSDKQETDLEPGELAPNFQLQTGDGRHLSLADLQGRPVLINFWATWCGPCRLEMPELVKTAESRSDLIILAVNVQEDLSQIQAFAEDFAMTMPIVRDTDGSLRQRYGVRGMPTSIFINKEGKIAAVWSGVLTKKLLNEFLATLD